MRQYRVFKVSHNGNDADRLNAFLRHSDVVAVEKQFVPCNGESYYSFLVEYEKAAGDIQDQDRKERTDYKKVLPEDKFACFAALRELRAKLSREGGIPPYLVFTNDMAEKMVRLEKPSKSELAAIDGFGESRLAKYGAPVLELLKKHAPAPVPAPA
jgi:superfamily II DNA helicase RecQ